MNLFVSLIRTGIPALVGWLVAIAAAHGLHLDAQALSGVLTPLAASATTRCSAWPNSTYRRASGGCWATPGPRSTTSPRSQAR
ncbi:hypothetical protein [Streptomyces sp. NPDC002573]|uniref:hypothetical protein n=1 Tax=Streptomyces sp. NPDC002573 TaxID=3364651 RepID=UPI0036ABA388